MMPNSDAFSDFVFIKSERIPEDIEKFLIANSKLFSLPLMALRNTDYSEEQTSNTNQSFSSNPEFIQIEYDKQEPDVTVNNTESRPVPSETTLSPITNNTPAIPYPKYAQVVRYQGASIIKVQLAS